MPARPANVSGRAPAASPSRVISARPRAMSDAFALSPSRRPSTPPAASAITFFAAAHSSTPTRSGLTYARKSARVERVLELAGEEAVLARDHGRRRQARGDLLRDVRAGEDGDGAAADARREALAGLRVEALGEAEHRRVARQRLDDLAEGLARHGGDDDVDVAGSVGERDRLGPAEVDALQVAGIPAGRRDRLRLLARAAREDDLVAALEEDARERRPPGARADHEKPHRQDRFTKSIETGTPSRPKRSRSRFSTQ